MHECFAFVSSMRNLDENAPNSLNHLPTLKLLDFSLRLCAVPLSVASIWFTVTNQQANSSYGKLEFSNLVGLKYMVCISALAAGYALVAALSSWVGCLANKAWVFFVSDQHLGLALDSVVMVGALQYLSHHQSHEVVTYLMVTSGAAVVEILYLAYNGDRDASWSEACNSYGRFCSRLKLALALHALALCCFLVVALISAYRVFSTFEPPSVPSKEVEEERN